MTEPQTPVRRLRSTTVHYMDLKEEERLPLGGLPTNRNVLEVILFQKSKDKQLPVDKVVCCSLDKTFTPKCSEAGGCKAKGHLCIVGQILERYREAGVPHMRPDKLKDNGIALFKLYRDDIKKHSDRKNQGEKVLQKRI